MIGYIKGKLLSYEGGVVLLENNGIGYEIACSNEAYKKLLEEKEGAIYTYTAVREDDISLYGFISQEEKKMFLKLISVSGVGPKMGITVLSSLSLEELTLKISMGDIKGLSSVKGLGKKTAERIILELQDKVGAGDISSLPIEKAENFTVDEDALNAIMSLGFTKSESMRALEEASRNGAKTLEELIAYAIKHIK